MVKAKKQFPVIYMENFLVFLDPKNNLFQFSDTLGRSLCADGTDVCEVGAFWEPWRIFLFSFQKFNHDASWHGFLGGFPICSDS